MCGGTSDNVHISGSYIGLSPRVRGNPPAPRLGLLREGSIPACAGEPWSLLTSPPMGEVYPRVCGGTIPAQMRARASRGLSPRVRGNLTRAGNPMANEWSIPACAGEPRASRLIWTVVKVYPRVCGGTRNSRPPAVAPPGLSPRVRGNRDEADIPSLPPRSIPACAGEPIRNPRRLHHNRVYPRVCGGTASLARRMIWHCGLSPRVRGNRNATGRTLALARSIPACAGEPGRMDGMVRLHAVYPRVCGGTSGYNDMPPAQMGLSPRVRGNPKSVRPNNSMDGSIPACAGEPERANCTEE